MMMNVDQTETTQSIELTPMEIDHTQSSPSTEVTQMEVDQPQTRASNELTQMDVDQPSTTTSKKTVEPEPTPITIDPNETMNKSKSPTRRFSLVVTTPTGKVTLPQNLLQSEMESDQTQGGTMNTKPKSLKRKRQKRKPKPNLKIKLNPKLKPKSKPKLQPILATQTQQLNLNPKQVVTHDEIQEEDENVKNETTGSMRMYNGNIVWSSIDELEQRINTIKRIPFGKQPKIQVSIYFLSIFLKG